MFSKGHGKVNIVSLFIMTLFILPSGSPSSMPHMPYEKSKMIDITRDKPIKIAVRVAVPVRDHPKVKKALRKTKNKIVIAFEL